MINVIVAFPRLENAKSIKSEKEHTEFKGNNKKQELSEVRITTDKPAYQKCLF